MITHLRIKDFILIDRLEIDLHSGLTAITGETGAGKSILIGAIGLVLGKRADARTVREGSAKAIVELECLIDRSEGLEELFAEHDLDYADTCLLRREVTAAGRSRTFINDTPVSVAVASKVGARLVDIHSQHHNMLIGDPEYQMQVVDRLADNAPLLAQYAEAYDLWRSRTRRLKEESDRIEQLKKDMDYVSFQYQQLVDAALKPGEEQQIEQRLSLVHHVEGIAHALRLLVGLDQEQYQEASMCDRIGEAVRYLEDTASLLPRGSELLERVQTLLIEARDIAAEAESLIDTLDSDPAEVEQLESRQDELQGLLYKHNKRDVAELIALRDEYAHYIETIDSSDTHLATLREEAAEARRGAEGLADRLTQRRREAATSILPALHELMERLHIAGATFQIEVSPLGDLGPKGADKVVFLIATNKKTTLHPIRDIASGGEISRFMLALKAILAHRGLLSTVIFDEIDSGVSGEVAGEFGAVMHEMSRYLQVLTITHLPQIAACADHHLLVRKSEESESYLSTIHPIDGDERVREVAAMLSGKAVTDAAIANARAMLHTNTTDK